MKISLALGGGGAKGNAHIGVLKALEASGHEITALAGTSMGGLVGAVYLAGHSPAEMEAHFSQEDYRSLFRRKGGESDSLMGLSGVQRMLEHMLADRTFADLPIPFAVTAVDLITGQELVLKEGRLLDAVLATIALPGIFPTKPWGDYLLVDGGISNPVPVSLARSLAPRFPVVAVVLAKRPEPHQALPEMSLLGPMPALQRISRFRLAQAFNVFARAMAISGRLLTEFRLDQEKPDLIIRPKVDHIALLENVDVHEVVNLGEEAALADLGSLQRRQTSLGKILSRLNPLKLLRRGDL